jgi:hypothetical protein
MRVITEEKLLAKRHQLKAELADLKRRARAIGAEMTFLDRLAEDFTDLTAPEATPSENGAADEGSSDGAPEGGYVVVPDPSGSPINKIQNPIMDLVTRYPGIRRSVVQRQIANSGLTSVESARETVRRMVTNGKLRMDEGMRLFPGSESAPATSGENGAAGSLWSDPAA